MTRIDLNGTWTCTLPYKRSLQIQVLGCWDTYVEEKDTGCLTILIGPLNSREDGTTVQFRYRACACLGSDSDMD